MNVTSIDGDALLTFMPGDQAGTVEVTLPNGTTATYRTANLARALAWALEVPTD